MVESLSGLRSSDLNIWTSYREHDVLRSVLLSFVVCSCGKVEDI